MALKVTDWPSTGQAVRAEFVVTRKDGRVDVFGSRREGNAFISDDFWADDGDLVEMKIVPIKENAT